MNKTILSDLLKITKDYHATLVAVSKTQSVEAILEVYQEGVRDFGENRVQELMSKVPHLPGDIRWHLIGHLQSNKVKYIAPFIHLIHSVDSPKLAQIIHQQALKCDRTIDILLQIHIATEETKYGFSEEEVMEFLGQGLWRDWKGIRIRGLMGMATFTSDATQVKNEFKGLRLLFHYIKETFFTSEDSFDTLSMGMSQDYKWALREGSNMIRVGSLIFGKRNLT